MSKNGKSHKAPTQQEIAARAHRLYELSGRPEGKSMEHWLQAERELIAEYKAQSAPTPAKTDGNPAGSSVGRPGQPASQGNQGNTPGNRGQNWQSQQRLPQHHN